MGNRHTGEYPKTVGFLKHSQMGVGHSEGRLVSHVDFVSSSITNVSTANQARQAHMSEPPVRFLSCTTEAN